MSKKWFWVLLVIFIVGGFTSGLLYRRYRTLLTQKPAKTPPPAQNFGSVVITSAVPSSNQKIYSVVVNGLIVEDLSLETVEVKGEKRPLLNLVVSFDYQGASRKLTIPVVENILLIRLGINGFGEGEVKSVESLNLKKGALVNVGFRYIPKEGTVKKRELAKYCSQIDYQLCLRYIELGFGDESIDFNVYLEKILRDQKTAKIDYKFVFPNTVYQITD